MKSKRAREAAAPVEENRPADIHTGGDEQPAKKRKRTDDGGDGSDSGAKKSKKDKKEKKEKKDRSKSKYSKESRKEKKEKRKDLLDLPEEDAGDEVNGEEEVKEVKKKSKKDKKTKEDKAAKETGENTAAADLKKEKKEKKEKKNSDAAAAVAIETSKNTGDTAVPAGASNGIDLDMDASGTETKNETAAAADAAANKADRHIVFVGNLPYSATAASISAHFASLSPIAVRCLTNKGDAKNTCRGIAFVEFANVWTQRTCLDRFHHSMFEDGVSPARKINVELTAGGGGKTQHRQDKIREKNIKLDENRAKRIEKEKTAKTENAGSSAQEQQQQQSSIEDAIHPSRRARVPGNRW